MDTDFRSLKQTDMNEFMYDIINALYVIFEKASNIEQHDEKVKKYFEIIFTAADYLSENHKDPYNIFHLNDKYRKQFKIITNPMSMQ